MFKPNVRDVAEGRFCKKAVLVNVREVTNGVFQTVLFRVVCAEDGQDP